ncbi:hypothetical protein [Methylocella sp.]|uniref:hypothetical protein n=1 Tax=Methylocella sp. TaxID=1978226 RepID=UPI0035B34CA8
MTFGGSWPIAELRLLICSIGRQLAVGRIFRTGRDVVGSRNEGRRRREPETGPVGADGMESVWPARRVGRRPAPEPKARTQKAGAATKIAGRPPAASPMTDRHFHSVLNILNLSRAIGQAQSPLRQAHDLLTRAFQLPALKQMLF